MNERMKPVFIEATTLDDCWYQLLQALYEKGRRYKITEGSYAGSERVAFDFVSGFVHYPHSRPLAPLMPEGSSLPPPTTDEEISKYFVNYLCDANLAPNEEYRYSSFLFGGEYCIPRITGLDDETNEMIECKDVTILVPNQIQWVIDHFKSKGFGNEHCACTIGYPESNLAYDVPYKNEQERRTSPCLRLLDFRVIDNQLTTSITYRSWDLVSGFPTNMGGFTLLNEYVAQELGIEPGPLSFSSKSLHSYAHSFEYLARRLGKEYGHRK